jgi:hypothetical protein
MHGKPPFQATISCSPSIHYLRRTSFHLVICWLRRSDTPGPSVWWIWIKKSYLRVNENVKQIVSVCNSYIPIDWKRGSQLIKSLLMLSRKPKLVACNLFATSVVLCKSSMHLGYVVMGGLCAWFTQYNSSCKKVFSNTILFLACGVD